MNRHFVSIRRLTGIAVVALTAAMLSDDISAATPACCMAVTAGVVNVASIAGATEYSMPWRRSMRSAYKMASVNSASIYKTTPDDPTEELLLGSPTLGRIAAFVLDPVEEVKACLRSDKQPEHREYGMAKDGPKPKLASNFFINLSSVNLGGGLSVKYRF